MTSNTNGIRAVLVVGASGSVGRLVVEEALDAGYDVRALVRTSSRLDDLAAGVEVVVGDPPDDLEPLFAALQSDPPRSLDAVLDEDNMPLSAEPESVRKDLEALGTREDTQ
jgi:nucleoside-diphosphate-sugar epimerase